MNFFKQYSYNGRNVKGYLNEMQHIVFQCSRSVINLKISVLEPNQRIEFLGWRIDTEKMALDLTEEKLRTIISECQNIYC